ncbi:MAG TPA: ABC transporter ATP-binding protein [Aestuariivirgaceae bacterium]|nr:ABC transporter ATP-binding protein [Aestuariivirgaceae bacterium]
MSPDTREPVLTIENLTIDLPPGADRAHAVEDVSFELYQRETLCIVGESGSGKSLTAAAILGLLPEPHVRASGGAIRFGTEDMLKISRDRLRRIRGAGIAMIFQEPMTALNPLMTIADQIDEVIRYHESWPSERRHARIIEVLDAVRMPDPPAIARAYPHQLSGGQRQRAMIAMALALEPKVLIADEPTTALDVTTQAQILKLIKDLQTEHQTGVLFITHDFGVVAEIADRVGVMQHGKLVEFNEADEVLNRPQHPYTKALIAAVPSTVPRIRKRFEDAPLVLTVQKLDKVFRTGRSLFGLHVRTVHAVKAVDLEVRRGETLGIVGESGSGKSTAARCIVRLVKPDSGTVLVDGTDILALSGRNLRPFRKRIQMIFQDPYASLNPRYKVGRIISENPIIHGMDRAEAHHRTHELLELVGLDARAADRYPHEFSGGQRQRIGIARALALDPEVLIADEPVSALDVSVQAQVLALLDDIRDRLNLAMVFITHDLRVAAQVCDTVAVMQHGKVVEHGLVAQVFADPQHAYTQELLSSIPGKHWQPPATGLDTAEVAS